MIQNLEKNEAVLLASVLDNQVLCNIIIKQIAIIYLIIFMFGWYKIMHEYGITKQIIKISTDAAKEYPNAKITDIHVVVGELTGFIGDSIQMYFDFISRGTSAEDSKLHIKIIPAKMYCSNCMSDFKRAKGTFNCPKCGTLGAPTDIGQEFYVENIEIDEE